jgi:UPF0755 protein
MLRGMAIAVGLLLLVTAGAAGLTWRELHRPQPVPAEGAMLAVPQGATFRTVARRLQSAGIVRYAWLLSLWARFNGLDRQIRSGDYRFEHALSPLEVLAVLRSPGAALHRVTIPDGSTLEQIGAILAEQGFGGSDAFACAARDPSLLADLDLPATGVEGYLFPDTYALQWRDRPQEIIRQMVARFRTAATEFEAGLMARGMDQHAWVTLASIVEKETGAAHERALVAAVFHNRLLRRWPLQSDPTVIYGLDSFDGNLTRAQLRTPTRYNTYVNSGLPPGPICSPGREALAAALEPASVDYLYFVARGDGSHHFSRTLIEHNRAVQLYQRNR